jgi:DNA-binding MarR family transcriptional regulator
VANRHPTARLTLNAARGRQGNAWTVSSEQKFLEGREEPQATSIEDDQGLIELRLNFNEVLVADEEILRESCRRSPSERELIRLACKLYNARRDRARMSDQKLMGEPAWDMLLALYCFPSQGICLGVTSLSPAANVAPTIGVKWLERLELTGLIRRGAQVPDGRQQLVALSEKGKLLTTRYLTRLFYCEGSLGAKRESHTD